MKKTLTAVACLSCVFLVTPQILKSQIVINEVSNANETTIYDQDGASPDWIELYNAGGSDINLMNYGLSNDTNALKKWVFPGITLPAKGFTTVFASGKDRKVTIGTWRTAIHDSTTWKYYSGATSQGASWVNTNFDDSSWNSGKGGIGFGDGDDNTVIASTTACYMRKKFNVVDTSAIMGAILHMDYDDGFVAYLNGVEIARANIGTVGVMPAHNAIATIDHEAVLYSGGIPEAFIIDKAQLKGLLVPGQNVLAISIHNNSNVSTDLSSRPFLSFNLKSQSTNYQSLPSFFNPGTQASIGENHTNFKLSKDGEKIFLTNSAGVLIDRYVLGKLGIDVSRGRVPDGGNSWCLIGTPTPGKTNGTSTCYSGYEPAPVFSVNAGFYTSNQSVTITAPSGTAVIRYTTNGSIPTVNSPIYKNPITISKRTVLSARTFSSGNLLPSHVRKNTYFINEQTIDLPVVSLTSDSSNLWDINTGIYVLGPPGTYETAVPNYGANFWEDWEKQSYIEYFDKTKKLGFESELDLAIHGGWSRANDQRSFRIKFDKKYENSTIKYKVIPDKDNINTFKSFNLRNTGNDYFGARCRDAFLQRLMKNTNVDLMGYNPVVVFLNGEYWGEYEIREHLDENAIENNYGVSANKVDLLVDRGKVEAQAGSDTGFVNLHNYVMNTAANDANFYKTIDSKLDLKNYTDYMAVEIFSSNHDWIVGEFGGANNIKFWRSQAPGSKWRHMLWDLDYGTGLYNGSVNDQTLNKARHPVKQANFSSDILNKVLNNTTYKNYFVNRFADLLNTVFTSSNLTTTAYAMRDEISSSIPRHAAKWGQGWYDASTFNGEVETMLSFCKSRQSVQRSQINTEFGLGGQVTVTLDVAPAGAGRVQISTVIPSSYPWNGVYFNGVPVTITAIANPGYTFTNWSTNSLMPSGSTNPAVTFNITSATTFKANFTGSATTPKITISEVNYNSESSLGSGNWVELYNYGTTPVDISDWRLRNESNYPEFKIPGGTILPAGGYFVVGDNPVSFAKRNPGVTSFAGPLMFNLDNGGGQIRVFDHTSSLKVSMTYDDSLPWPKGPDGGGRTLELVDPNSNLSAAYNWFDGCIGGSPGKAYSSCNDPIVFSEINFNSSFNSDADDWIELHNRTNSDIDLSGWIFKDSKDDEVFTFAASTNLKANDYLVVAKDLTKFKSIHPSVSKVVGPYSFSLSNTGELLRLYNNTQTLQFAVNYGAGSPWPSAANGKGMTLELSNENGKMNDAANWFAGCPNGSPGKAYDPNCVTGGTGIEQLENGQYMNMVVKAFSEEVEVEIITRDSELEGISFMMFDILGKEVKRLSSVSDSKISIVKAGINPGMYFINIRKGNQSITKKVVLQ